MVFCAAHNNEFGLGGGAELDERKLVRPFSSVSLSSVIPSCLFCQLQNGIGFALCNIETRRVDETT